VASHEQDTQVTEDLGFPPEMLRAMLRAMLLSRRFEEKAAEAYQMGSIGGFCHLYIGQEAVATGAISALRDDDYVITAYRDHAQALVRGVSADAVMAELYGRVGGSSQGAGGSMHIFDKSVNYLGGHGIVGTHLTLAAGVGYSIRYRNTDQVCLCFFGESVVNGGPFHEAFNMVAKWELPVVFIVENNSYGMGTDVERVAAIDEVYQRAFAYQGKAAEPVDGQDVLAMAEATHRAVERARKEKRPTFLEARTYRFLGHSMSDPAHGTYRSLEEVQRERKRDPIMTFEQRLVAAGVITPDEYEQMDREVIAAVESAADFSENSPVPGAEAIYRNVYSDEFRGGLDRRDAWR
jgi:pyruvate dehydrogenase E1 component subunit alpha